jgi:hypothetical protein
MTPEIKNTLIEVLEKAIKINKVLQSTCDLDKEDELINKRAKLDKAINWIKEQ